jgi:hypothetical protein
MELPRLGSVAIEFRPSGMEWKYTYTCLTTCSCQTCELILNLFGKFVQNKSYKFNFLLVGFRELFIGQKKATFTITPSYFLQVCSANLWGMKEFI